MGWCTPNCCSNVSIVQYIATEKQTGLDNFLKLAQDRVAIANENPKTGSGTPMFAADGVLGTLILSTGIFGGISVVFFIKGRQGKYAAAGRG